VGRPTASTTNAANEALAPRVLSGVMPTGSLHLGNYLGAIVHWVELQRHYESFFGVVDLHAITTPQDPRELHDKTREVAALFLAAGIDPRISTIFVQSKVPAHAELCWMLNCITSMGRLERMIQFKEKAGKERESASVGLFDYPVLQAADILLYGGEPPRTVLVPVGADQRQHLELARDLAARFNRRYGVIFCEPEPIISEAGARIMGLQYPLKKMSKSEKNPLDTVRLLDTPDEIRQKIAKAVTGPGREVRFDVEQPGLYNLLTIYELLSKKSRPEIEAHFRGKGYAEFKRELAELLIDSLRPLQERYHDVRRDPRYLEGVLEDGSTRARAESGVVLRAAMTAMGLG
jgi:tryptophanyl-tRNA synthetase